MEGVEHAVARVVGIEAEVDETGGEIALERESLKQTGPAADAVEVEVSRERFRLLVDDVERPVEVVDEGSPAARLVPHEVHPGQLSPRVLPIELAGDRHLRVILQLERQPGRWLRDRGLGDRKGQGQNAHRLYHWHFLPRAAHGMLLIGDAMRYRPVIFSMASG